MESSQAHEELYKKRPIWYYGCHSNNVKRTYLFMTGDETEEYMFGQIIVCPYAVAFECFVN